ncbi:MAG: hypothetical protein SFU83_22420 [Meiothermus sp.]|nr:hypothetical protein [Meiothermus sp.]
MRKKNDPINPHDGSEPDWEPQNQPDSVIGYEVGTGRPLTKSEVFPGSKPVPVKAPPPKPAQEEAPKTLLEHLSEGAPLEQLDLDKDPRVFEPDDAPGGWRGDQGGYSGDLKPRDSRHHRR